MKLFRPQKPKGQSAASTPRSPPPSSLDSPSLRGSDLSARIEPYTFGTPSPPAQTQSRTSSHHLHQQQHALPGSTDASTLPPARRHSMRARPSSEDPWVVVNDPSANTETRSSSIASLMQPVLGATGATAPFISTQFIQQRERDREPPWANASNLSASHPPSPNPPPQLRTPQPNISKQRPPASSSTPQPNLEQQQQQWQQPHPAQNQQPQPPPAGAQAPQQMNGLVPQPYPEDVSGYAMGNGGAYGNTNSGGREGSIHSQQDKSWTRGFFGASTGKEKEANAELMRMIGFLTAAAPDDWNLVLEVCERASANESAAKEAARALRREFKYGEPSAQLSAARLWAIMLQNATDTFILQTASRKFLENLEEVINAESTSPVVRERLLDVLASAAYVYGKMPGKEGFASTWRKVRPSWKPAEGVPFDPEDTLFDSAFPRRPVAGAGLAPGVPVGPGQGLAPGLVPPQVPGSQFPSAGNYGERDRRDDRSRRDRDRDRDRDKYHRQQQQYEATQYQPYRAGVAPPVPTRKDRGIIPPEEDMRRLLQECDVAKNNAQVLSQALPFATPATLGTDTLIQEFHTKCRASQELIVAQIPWASAGAERSRVAAAIRKSQKENSGSDGAANGKLTKKAPQNGSVDLTKEEKLLAALLTANQELVEVFRIYEELEKLAFDEMEEREVAKRSKVETKLDRAHIQYISPDGSMLMEPASQGASSSSRSPSPAIQTANIRASSATSMPSAISPVVKVPGARDLPHPPHQSNDHLSPNNPSSLPPSPAVYQQQQNSHSHQQSLSQMPPSPMQMTAPSQQQSMPSPQAPPAQPHHAHHASNPSLGGGGHVNLNIPPSAPHGPRQPTGAGTRSRTPSPDRNGNFTPSHTPPIVAQTHAHMNAVPNPADYGPPTHPPPQFTRGAATPAGARSVDSHRGRGESPANLTIGGGGPPPGLAAVQNTAGMRIDMDAARRYSSEEDDLMTPVKPSAKAMGKRKAGVEAPPDEEELERREEAEMEEAFMRSTAPPEEGGETPVRSVQYVYDAAAERARELDRLEREEQELRRQQTRSSMQRIPGMGGGSGAGSVGAMNATKSLA